MLLEDGSVRRFPFGADDARAKATVLKGKMLMGVDPIVEKEQAAAAAVAKTGEYTILAKNPVERARKIKNTAPHEPRDWRIPARKIGAAWSFLRQRAARPVKELDRTAADWLSTRLLTGWRATECVLRQ
jgi:hypothetical protein